MQQVQLPVQVVVPETDETPLLNESPQQLVRRLSLAKAQAAKAVILAGKQKGLVIAADTIVVKPGGRKILGKPRSPSEAQEMLKSLSGKTHSVLTGYCILEATTRPRKRDWVRVVESRVKIRKLSVHTIQQYIATGEPMDKAGAYGAQGIGGALIDKIEGSFTNVVGLPMTELLSDLEKNFKIQLLSWVR